MQEIVRIIIVITLFIVCTFFLLKMLNVKNLFQSENKNNDKLPKANDSLKVCRVYTFGDFPAGENKSPIYSYFHPYVEVKYDLNSVYANNIYEHIIRAPKIYYMFYDNSVVCVFKDYKLGYVKMTIRMIYDKINFFEFYIVDKYTSYVYNDMNIYFEEQRMRNYAYNLYNTIHDLYYFVLKQNNKELEL